MKRLDRIRAQRIGILKTSDVNILMTILCSFDYSINLGNDENKENLKEIGKRAC